MRLTSFGWVAGLAMLAAACGGPAVVDGGTDGSTRMDVRTDTGGGCPSGQMSCGGTCVDTSTSTANCGMCGRSCAAGQSCTAGTCTGGSDGGMEAGMCPTPGDVMCMGACTNTQTDTMNCGSCGHACMATETCVTGACRAAMMCSMGQTDCGMGCVDTLTNAMNCGMCGRACMSTETCTGGVCVPMMCPTGQMRCGMTCADTMTDNANCGSCGMACAAGQMCVSGTCQTACAAPRMLCTAGMMTACVDTSTDPNNCGACGTVCMGGATCTGSSCSCPTGRMMCGTSCVDTQTDAANCGMCGRACPSGVACVAGSCACPSGLTLCGTGSAGVCTSTQFDPMNCGTCGHPCTGATPTCVMGTCMGSACVTAPLTTLCGGMCIDRLTNNMNCGSCGNVCGTGTNCQAGVCRPANNDRANATAITLGTAETTVMGSTTNATHDGPSPCGCTGGGNVWYRFTVAARAVVYFDTAGTGFDTSVYITDMAGTAIANACNDDSGCTTGGFTNTLQSRVATVLAPGTYYVAVGGCGSGNFTLHAQQIPTNLGSFFYETPITSSGNTATSLVGTSRIAGTCGGTASGEDVRWFMTCGAQPQFFSLCQSDARGGMSASYTRRIGTINYDPSMYIRSGQTGAEVTCNDDGITMGGSNCQGTGGDTAQYGSRLNNVSVPRGINAVIVDERTGGSGMQYRLVFQVQ